MRSGRVLAVFAAVILGGTGAAPAAEPVDLALVLAIDDSASITEGGLDFQLQGHAAAFADPSVAEAILAGPRHTAAVVLAAWSGPESLEVLVPWRVLRSPQDAADFAARILQAGRRDRTGATAIGSAIDRATALFAESGVDAERRVIDLSSNGFNNAGEAPEIARDRAVAAGVTVNALAILDEFPWLEGYFAEAVIGGPGAFVGTAESRDSFAQAIRNKLIREIVGIDPGTRIALVR